jgi:hypothetical protein
MKMGDLVNLWDVAAFGERGEPSARAALLRVASAMTAAQGEIERVLIGRQKLEGEMSKVADVKRDLQDRIKLEAASLVAAMKSSAQWALGQFGNRATRKTEELLGASSIQTAIGEQALAEAAEELQRLEERRERLRVAKAGIIKEVVREALQEALLADYGVILERLQETTARLKGIERYLTPPGHDYRPGATRLSVLVPGFKGDGSDMALTVEAREVQKVEAFLHSFAAALEHDPRSPAPELPEFDASADPSTTYDMLTGPERAAVDRDFVAVTSHRKTVDSELFAEQLREAKALVCLTN